MLDMFDYMSLRPVLEPVFHDNMDIANTIIKAIQTYHDDEDYVPKVSQSYSMVNLENTVIFQIDSQKLVINNYDAGYNVNLIATRFDIIDERPLIDYKVSIDAYCDVCGSDDIRAKGYVFAVHGNPYDPVIAKEIESGIFEKHIPEVLGKLVWAVLQERFKTVKNLKASIRGKYKDSLRELKEGDNAEKT